VRDRNIERMTGTSAAKRERRKERWRKEEIEMKPKYERGEDTTRWRELHNNNEK